MEFEPEIDRGGLAEAVRREYGLAVERLEFVPAGFASVCYVVHRPAGERTFLKLWPDRIVGRMDIARLDLTLRLTLALHERGLPVRVPFPLRTLSGAMRAAFAGVPFALFTFLRGRAAPRELPPALADELARTVAAIHAATPAVADLLPPRERFDLSCEAELLGGLQRLDAAAPVARTAWTAARDLVLPYRDEILAQIERLHALQRAVRGLQGPLVLCHTDLGGDNMLVDDRGRLSVLDWDTAVVGPPEHDLQAGLSADFARFLRVYRDAGGAASLHAEHFAFYLLRRGLEDFTARLVCVQQEDVAPREGKTLLQGMITWGVERWRSLDPTMAVVERALDQVRDGPA